MDLGFFSFEGVAPGLVTSHTNPVKRTWIVDRETYNAWNPSRWISRTVAGPSQFLDETGKAISSAEAADAATTWKTMNSFSGRCGLAKPNSMTRFTSNQSDVRRADISTVAPLWLSRSPKDYREWSVQFYLRSSVELPSILVSVGPYFYPYASEIDLMGPRGRIQPFSPIPSTAQERYQFDRKMLQTPLIWEEPYTMSVEVNKDGTFFWSDTWELFGVKAGDEGMQDSETGIRFGDIAAILQRSIDFETMPGLDARPHYEAFVRLDWCSSENVDENTGKRAAKLEVWRGFLDEKSGVYEQEELPMDVDEEPSMAEEASSTSSTGSDKSESLRLGGKVKVVQLLRCNWTKIGEQAYSIPKEAVDVMFAPYVTLLSGGDTAIVIGGHNGRTGAMVKDVSVPCVPQDAS